MADNGRPIPEIGRRTPQPTIARNDRFRFTSLQLDEVIGILREAEDGFTERLADLWLRMLKTDAHLASVWETRMAPIYGARWEVAPADVSEDEQAATVATACEEALRNITNLPRVFSALLDGVGLGYAVVEIEWGRGTLLGKPAWVPIALHPVHGRRFAFSDFFEIGLYDSGFAVSQLMDAGWPVDVIASRGRTMARLPAGKYIVHQPVTLHDYPTATGKVHPVSRWWWAKQVVTKYWLGGAETFANPRYHGHVEQESPGSSVMKELHEGLERLAADGVITTRGKTELTVLDQKGEGAARTWESLAKFLDAAMSKLIIGSTLNVEIGESGGNRAAAESQDDTTIRPRQEQDAGQMWATIRRDLFAWIVKFNPHLFPPKSPLPTGMSVLAEDPVEVDQLTVDAGAVTVDELRESRGLAALNDERGARTAQPLTREALPSAQPEGVPQEDVQQAALNGAQVTSLLEIVSQVAQALIPRDTAVELIVSAFPISRQQAERILGDVGRGFVPSVAVEDATVDTPDAAEVGDVPLPTSLSRAMSSVSRAATATSTP